MSDIAIRVEKLSKMYRIRGKVERHDTLRDIVSDAVTAPFRRIAKLLRGQATGAAELDEALWALKDLNFEVKTGEVIGIIGRNGAGKSTLLKILTRITLPTEGCAFFRGRVASLLEVGTGFHKELTGRENIYLNGSIMGMKRAEIDRNLDEIVAFAEVEKFLDTPVKHYSSGMYLRLAFAVAAHLDPDILLVDEVLAVGDAAFQKKCLKKMEDVGRHGRTILFVSHNMPAITRLCKRTILLDEGALIQDGPSHQVVASYLNAGLGTMAERTWKDLQTAPGNDIVRLIAARVRTEEGKISDAVDIRSPVGIEMEYEVLKSGYALWPYYSIYNDQGILVFHTFDLEGEWRRRPRSVGKYVSTAWIPGNLLAEGTLIVTPAIRSENPSLLHFYERDAIAVQVVDSLKGDSARGDYSGTLKGVVRPLLNWTTHFSPNGRETATIFTQAST